MAAYSGVISENFKHTGWLFFSRRQILVAAFIASLPAGFFLIALNYLSARRIGLFLLFLTAACCSSLGVIVAFIIVPPSPIDKLIPLVSVLLMLIISRRLLAFEGIFRSWLSSVLLSLLVLAAQFVLASKMLPYLVA